MVCYTRRREKRKGFNIEVQKATPQFGEGKVYFHGTLDAD